MRTFDPEGAGETGVERHVEWDAAISGPSTSGEALLVRLQT